MSSINWGMVETIPEPINKKSCEAINYLRSTDWYVLRKTETGKEIPEDVAAFRAQARLDL